MNNISSRPGADNPSGLVSFIYGDDESNNMKKRYDYSEGPEDAAVMLVGQNPGREEVLIIAGTGDRNNLSGRRWLIF